jgi:hypothetical protein
MTKQRLDKTDKLIKIFPLRIYYTKEVWIATKVLFVRFGEGVTTLANPRTCVCSRVESPHPPYDVNTMDKHTLSLLVEARLTTIHWTRITTLSISRGQ